MRPLVCVIVTPVLCSVLLAGGTALAAPSAEQTVAAEELTVLAPARKSRGPADTYSYRVSFHDIDIRTKAGEDELRRRIKVTARYVCKKLDEPSGSACEGQAVSDAMSQVRDAIHYERVHRVRWTPGATWNPPPVN